MAGYDVTRPSALNRGRGSCCRRFYGHRSRCLGTDWRSRLKLIFLLVSMAIGIALGALLRHFPPFDKPGDNPRPMWYVFFPGEIFVRIISVLSVPLLLSSIISGVTSLRDFGKVGACAMAYYVGTTTLACAEGFGLAFAIRPGSNMTLPPPQDRQTAITNTDALLDLIRNIFPDNLVETSFKMTRTNVEREFLPNATDGAMTANTSAFTEGLSLRKDDDMNPLGLTMVAIIFAITLTKLGPLGKPVTELFDSSFAVIMYLVSALLWVYPIGIISIIATAVIRLEDPQSYLVSMAWFLLSAVAGLTMHVLVILPAIYAICLRRNPFRYMRTVAKALLTALATNDSTVTLPVTVDCLERNPEIDSRVARFMCPLGATINMDGAALYQAMTVIFVATMRGKVVGVTDVLASGLTAILLSIGAPSAGSGIVIWMILFRSLGLPVEDVFILIPFDQFMGRLRTLANVWGDCVGVAAVQQVASPARSNENEVRAGSDLTSSPEPSPNFTRGPFPRRRRQLVQISEV